jgi:hypothetical protein
MRSHCLNAHQDPPQAVGTVAVYCSCLYRTLRCIPQVTARKEWWFQIHASQMLHKTHPLSAWMRQQHYQFVNAACHCNIVVVFCVLPWDLHMGHRKVILQAITHAGIMSCAGPHIFLSHMTVLSLVQFMHMVSGVWTHVAQVGSCGSGFCR